MIEQIKKQMYDEGEIDLEDDYMKMAKGGKKQAIKKEIREFEHKSEDSEEKEKRTIESVEEIEIY